MTVSRTENRQRQFHSARDFETSSSQIGDVEPFAEAVRRRAQIVICGNSENIEDATELLSMLGVHPSQEVSLISSPPPILPRSHR